MPSSTQQLAQTVAFNAITATDGSGLQLLNASNIASGTLVVARGGTGVSTFGGTNRLLFTTATDTLSNIITANSSVLVTNGSGVPAWSTTLPAVNGAAITNLSAANISAGTLAVARGGTNVGTFGGTNTLLYTTAADTLSNIVTANSAVLITSAGGVPSWGTTLPAVSGANLTSLNAGNVSSGTLVVGRGGTGVTTFGGTNSILFTTAANTLSSVTAANSSVLISSAGGVPSWSTTLPTIGKVTVSSADGTAFQGAFTRSGQFNKCFNAHGAAMVNTDYAQFSWGRSLAANESAELNFIYDTGGNSQVAFGIYGSPGIFTIFNDGSSSVGGALKLASYTVAGLPTGTAGRIVFVSNGRKNGEGAGAGSGTLAYADGAAWRRVSDDTTVAA